MQLKTQIRGIEYSFIDTDTTQASGAKRANRATILLLHGFPDLGIGWRFQIEFLSRNGFRVIAPDMPGYGGTETPVEVERYSFHSVVLDMVALIDSVVGKDENVFIGCHEWGGMVGWRMSQYFPSRVRGLISFCTSFQPTNEEWIPTERLVEMLPNLTIQLIFEQDKEIAEILTENCEDLFDFMFYSNEKDIEFRLEQANPFVTAFKSPVPLKSKVDTSYHKQQFSKKGFVGPMNWYKTRKINHDFETESLKNGTMLAAPICPTMLVIGLRDSFLTPKMAHKIKKFLPDCTVEALDATHWLLVEEPEKCNHLMLDFFNRTSPSSKL